MRRHLHETDRTRARDPGGSRASLLIVVRLRGRRSRLSPPTRPGPEALHAVLDAWKAGEKPEDLEKRTPPIHVKDVDWNGGFRLVGYKADAKASSSATT